MARTKISEWSSTASSNTDIDGINIAEGCAPSGINNAIREMMSQVKDFQSGVSGDALAIAGGGTGATTADNARTNLGLVIGTDVQAASNVLTTYASTGVEFRNRIINGDMRIDQRNAGASVTPSTGTYSLDRWRGFSSQSSKFTIQQNAGGVTPPAGFSNYLGAVSSAATSLGATDLYLIQQFVEAFNMTDLAWGTASAQSVTLSFWVRSSLTGTFGANIQNNIGDRSYPFTYVINSANTWEYKTVTIPGSTSGTWESTNGKGIALSFSLGAGSNVSGTAGAWTTTVGIYSATGTTSVVGTNGATFYITGVQLEAGSVATPFERRDYGRELIMCQRYCRVDDMKGMLFGNLLPAGTDEFYLSRTIPNMRTAPACIFPDGYPTSLQRGGVSLVGSVVTNNSTENAINLLFDTGTAQTVGNYYASTSAGSFRIVSSSEL